MKGNPKKVIIVGLGAVIIVGVVAAGAPWGDESSEQEKVFEAPTRNFENIQHEDIRRSIDARFNTLADELSDAYYNYWRQGRSHDWQGYDVLPTAEETKAQFDNLHGLIWAHYDLAFHEENQRIGNKYNENEYRYLKDENGNILVDRVQAAQDLIKLRKKEGYEISI